MIGARLGPPIFRPLAFFLAEEELPEEKVGSV
jgi:hypothetical protein